MNPPPYFKQSHASACSLSVLRMVLAAFGKNITEEELLKKVTKDYGNHFKNIWNPTIAKLAREYNVPVTMYALWSLFQKEKMKQALQEFENNPNEFNIAKYENRNDKDTLSEALPLSYKEMLKAVEKECKVVYGKITTNRIKKFLNIGSLIQTSIKLHKMYPGKKHAFHSILLYGYSDNHVYFHDPYNGASLHCTFEHLQQATVDVGAAIVYRV